jgi:hypothetical protein
MNNETFGMTFQYAVCQKYKLENNLSVERIDKSLLKSFLDGKIISQIFRGKKPIKFLSTSKDFTSKYIKRCPHNFLLENNQTFSIRTFKGDRKMFAPKVVGQAGDDTFNHFFGHLSSVEVSRANFKEFCLKHIDEMLPIIVDYALVSDYNCWLYLEEDTFKYEIHKRDDLPELTYDYSKFTFSKPTVIGWNESNTIKYNGISIVEIQLHSNRTGFKIRLHRENFTQLLKVEKETNNSLLGDTAELAICNVFKLESGEKNERLLNNSDKRILKSFENHYSKKKTTLFPLKPIKYAGTDKRERGGLSKSGVDFFLEKNSTLSVKTNKSKSFKVCPPEIGQPSPKTFDIHFSNKGWYEGAMNEEKFRLLVRDKTKLAILLGEYVSFLNECDFILWTLFINESNINSKLVSKNELLNKQFNPKLISYSNNFKEKSSVTIKYGLSGNTISLGEFQVHSARNSLKFRFNFNNLLAI